MAKQRDFKVFLFDILDSAKNILEFTKGMDAEKFKASLLACSGVQHQIMIIGEATKRIPEDLKKQYTSVPWKAMAGMRDILIHQYHNARSEEVWKVVVNEIPPLVNQIEKILEEIQSKTK